MLPRRRPSLAFRSCLVWFLNHALILFSESSLSFLLDFLLFFPSKVPPFRFQLPSFLFLGFVPSPFFWVLPNGKRMTPFHPLILLEILEQNTGS
jgi:hypothetical protein